MKCKNIECQNETTGKRVYCSLSCRNIFVNKYLRDYTKYTNTCEKKKKEREEEYLESPKFCKECKIVIPFEKIHDNDLFCSKSCSNSYSNKNRKGISYNLTEEGLNTLRNSAFLNFGIKPKEKVEKICIECGQMFSNDNKKFCGNNCKKNYHVKNTEPYQRYKQLANFKFNLKDYSDEFDFSLVKEHGWYSPTNKNNNLDGVSRDHMFSVREGFEKGIDSKIISHPANCRLMIHNENISKNKKSVITIEELLDRIEKFEQKYKDIGGTRAVDALN